MRRAFAANILLLLAVNALVKPAYLLGIDLGVQNAVGTAEYGRYGYWFSFAFVFGTVLDFGLQNYNAVTMSRRPELIRQGLPVTLSLKLALSAAYVLLVLAAAVASGAPADDLYLVGLIVLTQVALSTWQLLRTNVAAQGKYQVNSLLSVADKAQLLLVVGAVLLYPPLSEWITIERFVLLQLGALLVSIAGTLYATDVDPGQRWLRWDAAALRDLARAAAPYALTLLLSTTAAKVDILMIERLLPDGFYAVGVYVGGYRLLDAINMVSFLFATLLIPMLGSLTERGEPVRPLLRQGTQYMLALTVGAATFLTFHAQAVTELLYREADQTWGPVLAALAWSAVGTGATYIQGSYLLVLRKIKLTNLIFVAATVLNLGLNLVLLPRYGVWGAAVATALTQSLIGGVEWAYTRRLGSGAEAGASAGVLTRGILVYGATTAAVAYVTDVLHWPLWGAGLAHAAGCAVSALSLGMVVAPAALLRRLRDGGRA